MNSYGTLNSVILFGIAQYSGGEGGIRTLVPLRTHGFQDQPTRPPLRHQRDGVNFNRMMF